MSTILFSSAIGPVPVDVIIRENHESSLGITTNPIETGANVTDHAYIEPKRLALEFVDKGAALTYGALVRFQESRVPVTVVSGLFVYRNMLIANLTAERDEVTSRIVAGAAQLQEVILVSTSSTGGRAGDAATADRTAGTVARGDQPTRDATVPLAGAFGR